MSISGLRGPWNSRRTARLSHTRCTKKAWTIFGSSRWTARLTGRSRISRRRESRSLPSRQTAPNSPSSAGTRSRTPCCCATSRTENRCVFEQRMARTGKDCEESRIACAGHATLERAGALGARLLRRFAWNHFVAVGRQVHERSYDHRHLLHIRLLDAFVDIHVGVVRARVVIERVLDELKPGQAHGIERKMIGAAGVANRQRSHAEIVERLHPFLEKRLDGLVALEIDAADFP